MAIDVTIPSSSPTPTSSDLPDLPQLAELASRAHHDAARHKFTKDQYTASLCNEQNILLLPFTVDHLGGLGSFAHNLLFPNPTTTSHFLLGPNLPPPWHDDKFGLGHIQTRSL